MIKAIILVIWALAIASLFIVFPPTVDWVFKGLGLLFLIAHPTEYLVFRNRIAEKGDGTAKSLLMTMIFGLAYIKS